jgi:hypothetical protein
MEHDSAEIHSALHEIKNLINKVLRHQLETRKELKHIMSAQDDLNALVASEDADLAAIGTAIQTVKDEVAAAIAANPAIDLSGLKAAEAQLSAVSGNVLAIAPTPAPPVA